MRLFHKKSGLTGCEHRAGGRPRAGSKGLLLAAAERGDQPACAALGSQKHQIRKSCRTDNRAFLQASERKPIPADAAGKPEPCLRDDAFSRSPVSSNALASQIASLCKSPECRQSASMTGGAERARLRAS